MAKATKKLAQCILDIVRWLEGQPGVRTVVQGNYTRAGHHHGTGFVRALKGDDVSVHVRAYDERGVKDLFVHASPGPQRDAWTTQLDGGTLFSKLKPPTPTARRPLDLTTPAARVTIDERAASLVQVTPELALSWLEKNTRNRALRQSTVNRYAEDMRAGRWMVSPDAIAFDTSGAVVNGQHRLWAVVEAGIPVPMTVMDGLQPDVVTVLDDHLKRSLKDVVAIRRPGSGVQNIHTAIAARLLETIVERTSSSVTQTIRRISRQEQIDVLDRHWDAIEFAWRECFHSRTPAGISTSATMTPLARAYYSQDKSRLITFGQVLITGIMGSEDDKPAALLRR